MRVLIVEDEAVIAMEIETIVRRRLPDAEIVFATSVGSAMAKADDDMVAAFLDIDVTDGKTYPLALKLRSLKVPFVFVSGARSEDTPPELRDANLIVKPFASIDILRSIESMVGDNDK